MEKRKSNILVIDDDPLICESIGQIIEKEGHEAFTASNLEKGFALLQSGTPFDLVFLDVRLPDGNGIEQIGAILQGPTDPDVIIITGFGSPEGAELALNSGALDYIEKPMSAGIITLRLRRALDHQKQKLFWLKIREAFSEVR